MRFIRMCPKLLGPELSAAEADSVYQRAKGTSGNRLNMIQFNEEILPQLAVLRFSNEDSPEAALQRMLGDHMFYWPPMEKAVWMEAKKRAVRGTWDGSCLRLCVHVCSCGRATCRSCSKHAKKLLP